LVKQINSKGQYSNLNQGFLVTGEAKRWEI